LAAIIPAVTNSWTWMMGIKIGNSEKTNSISQKPSLHHNHSRDSPLFKTLSVVIKAIILIVLQAQLDLFITRLDNKVNPR
jgi:hypothetical protein